MSLAFVCAVLAASPNLTVDVAPGVPCDLSAALAAEVDAQRLDGRWRLGVTPAGDALSVRLVDGDGALAGERTLPRSEQDCPALVKTIGLLVRAWTQQRLVSSSVAGPRAHRGSRPPPNNVAPPPADPPPAGPSRASPPVAEAPVAPARPQQRLAPPPVTPVRQTGPDAPRATEPEAAPPADPVELPASGAPPPSVEPPSSATPPPSTAAAPSAAPEPSTAGSGETPVLGSDRTGGEVPAVTSFGVAAMGAVYGAPGDTLTGGGQLLGEWGFREPFGLALAVGAQSDRRASLGPGAVTASLQLAELTARLRLRLAERTHLWAGLGVRGERVAASSHGYLHDASVTLYLFGGLATLELRQTLTRGLFIALHLEGVLRAHPEAFTVDGIGRVLTLPAAELGAGLGVGWNFD